jgi:hypothetical protein
MVSHKTIFSHQKHTTYRKATKLGYNFSKALIVSTLLVTFLGVGTLQVFAGNNNKHNAGAQKHTVKNSKKTTVTAKAGNKNNYGNSNSRAHVNNSISVNVGSGTRGGFTPAINRGSNDGNNHKKKVVRKVTRKKVVNNTTTVNTNIDKDVNNCYDCYQPEPPVYNPPVYNPPSCKYNCGYKPPHNPCKYGCKHDDKDYDHDDYDKDWKKHSYREGNNYSNSTNSTYVENNNNNDNYNDNNQYLDVSFPNYYN